MAILINEHALAEIARRRAQGREADLVVSVCRLRGMARMLRIDWVGRRSRATGLVAERVGDIVVYVPRRLARYARWVDVTISAWRLGPFARLGIVDEPLVTLAMADWERSHPAYEHEVDAW